MTMETASLTGRTRYREKRRFFRPNLLVLQVEIRSQGRRSYSAGASIEEDPFDFTFWRDAKAVDLINNPGSHRHNDPRHARFSEAGL